MVRSKLFDEVDTKAHYFVLLHPLEITPIPGYGAIVSTSNMTRPKWVECVIDEEKYIKSGGYRVEVVSIEPGYGKESFYTEDFLSNLKTNYRVAIKEPGMECVEVTWEEPLTPTVNVRHSAYTLKKVPQQEPKRKR